MNVEDRKTNNYDTYSIIYENTYKRFIYIKYQSSSCLQIPEKPC